MMRSTLVLLSASGLALLIVYVFSPETAGKGLKASGTMALGALLPMVAGFLMAGLALVIIPKDFVVQWMGHESGWKGVLIGWGLGIAMPGVTSVQFPVVVAMLNMGVGTGPLISYLSAWALLQFNRLIVWEIPFLGSKLALLRFGICFFLPPLVGWLCAWAWERWFK